MKLISMTDFVLYQRELGKGTVASVLNSIFKYADFLKQPLELWMFVPCDEDGNVLDEPNYPFRSNSNDLELMKEWEQAKERCLFDGWNQIAKIDITICIENESKHRLFLPNCMTIENIVYTNSQLTETALKQLSL